MLPEFTFCILIVEDNCILLYNALSYHRVATHETTPYEYLNVAISLILNFNHELGKNYWSLFSVNTPNN